VGFSWVKEGQATILQQGNSVFYNKAQVVNRDVSMAVLRWFITQKQTDATKPKRKQRPVKLPEGSVVKVRHFCCNESLLDRCHL
jgi:tRNA (guanine26-N2/guanine27-N2)-dimethyltransferase